MRSETEMLDLIIGTAQRDARVRAVALGGSRVTPGATRDCFSDYDVIYAVTAVEGFTADHSWVDIFGERTIMQMPETNTLPEYSPEGDGHFTYLMQFVDGTRIDLSLYSLQAAKGAVTREPNRCLLDKDGLLAGLLEAPSDGSIFHVQRPSPAQYADCCNEFWWVGPYVAKGLWRGQLLYATRHMDSVIRPMLYRMLEWQAGAENAFAVSTGSSDKYLPRYLAPGAYQALLDTHNTASPQGCWDSLFACGRLFRESAQQVAALLGPGYTYPTQDDARVNALLRQVHAAQPGECPF